MGGSYYFVPARAVADRELGYTDKFPTPIPLDQMELELLTDLGIADQVQESRFHWVFDYLTDLGWYSLYGRGGHYVEHHHWATYIRPRIESTIRQVRADPDKIKQLPVMIAFLAKAEEMLLRKYRFYGTG